MSRKPREIDPFPATEAEQVAVWPLSKAELSNVRDARVQRAAADFPAAADLAMRNGMTLRQCSIVHYQLEHGRDGWLMNLYPTNTRVWSDPNRPKAPYLDLCGVRWTLTQVVEAAIRKATNP